MFLCLKRRLKRRNAWFWRFKQRFKHRNASGFGVFDIYGQVYTQDGVEGERSGTLYSLITRKYMQKEHPRLACRCGWPLEFGRCGT